MSNYSLADMLDVFLFLGKYNGFFLCCIPGKLLINKLELSTPPSSRVIDCSFDCFCDLFVQQICIDCLLTQYKVLEHPVFQVQLGSES